MTHHRTGDTQVIMSFTDELLVTFGPFSPSLMSRLNTERFWVNLSRFLVNRFLSIPSIKLSNQVIIDPLLSLGWDEITWSRRFWKKIQIAKIRYTRIKDVKELISSPGSNLHLGELDQEVVLTWTTDCDNLRTWWCLTPAATIHFNLQPTIVITKPTVCNICWRISGLILTTVTKESLSGDVWLLFLDFLPTTKTFKTISTYCFRLTFIGHFLE